jgi:methylated-DNA-[protein]-cysteine S-methyltransferase
MMRYRELESPLGAMLAVSDGEALCSLHFVDGRQAPCPREDWRRDPGAAPFDRLAAELDEYWAGVRRRFDVPVRLAGTPFQRAVWAAIAAIPYGETISYGDLASRIGRPSAVRAAGAATGRNPVSIVVPCHRVVGAGRSLVGYGGGLERKRALLELERRVAGGDLRAGQPRRDPAVPRSALPRDKPQTTR